MPKVMLTVSGKEAELHSLKRSDCVELLGMEKQRAASAAKAARGDDEALSRIVNDEFVTRREACVREMHPELEPWDDLPNRDVLQLINETWLYSLGYPEEEIKNLLRSGGSQPTQTD